MIASTAKDYAKIVAEYCEAVRSGERVAGRYEKMAVERYLDDRENAHKRGWVFDEQIAQKSCTFFPSCLRHTMGRWAGEPYELSPWQVFVEWNVSGWRCIADGFRRFRKVYVTIARKNGKTTGGAAKTVQLTFADIPAENLARGYCAATSQEQATLLWSEAARMIGDAPWLDEACKITGVDNIKGGVITVKTGNQKGATLQPIGSNSKNQDGKNPTVVTKDELHEWRPRHRGLHEKLSTGGAARDQPLELIYTTAGDDDSEIWEEEHDFACRVVEAGSKGHVVDDTVFAFICQIDEEDDPVDESCWPKANPNIDISVSRKYLRAQAVEAIAKPSAYKSFVRYHCNRRVGSFEQSYPSELWDRGNLAFPEPEDGALCFVGVDLGRTNDWAAWSAVFPQVCKDANDNLIWRYKIRSRAYCCKGVNVQVDYTQPPYSLWIADDLMSFQTDESLDTAEMKADILEMRKKYKVQSLPYDDSFAKEFALDLFNTHGMPAFNFYQTHLRYNEPLINFEKALVEGRIDHGNDPVLNFQAGNCQYNYDPKGRRMLDKGNRQRWKKIDGMVAMIMAFSEAIYYAKNAPPPVYNRRGVLTI